MTIDPLTAEVLRSALVAAFVEVLKEVAQAETIPSNSNASDDPAR